MMRWLIAVLVSCWWSALKFCRRIAPTITVVLAVALAVCCALVYVASCAIVTALLVVLVAALAMLVVLTAVAACALILSAIPAFFVALLLIVAARIVLAALEVARYVLRATGYHKRTEKSVVMLVGEEYELFAHLRPATVWAYFDLREMGRGDRVVIRRYIGDGGGEWEPDEEHELGWGDIQNGAMAVIPDRFAPACRYTVGQTHGSSFRVKAQFWRRR
jgi:hypothetical protein